MQAVRPCIAPCKRLVLAGYARPESLPGMQAPEIALTAHGSAVKLPAQISYHIGRVLLERGLSSGVEASAGYGTGRPAAREFNSLGAIEWPSGEKWPGASTQILGHLARFPISEYRAAHRGTSQCVAMQSGTSMMLKLAN